MMISPEQTKAARAMLDWSQDILAQEAGVSPATIYNFEKGHQSYSSSRKIREALERKGFEFIGTKGLNRCEETRTFYEGPDSCDRFYEDMLATAKHCNGEVAAIYRTSEQFARSLGVTDFSNLERLEKLSKLARVKCLLSDARDTTLLIAAFQFKAIPQHPFEPLAIFICGDKYTIVITNGREFSFYVMKSADRANAEMLQFTRHWNVALPLVVQGNNSKLRA